MGPMTRGGEKHIFCISHNACSFETIFGSVCIVMGSGIPLYTTIFVILRHKMYKSIPFVRPDFLTMSRQSAVLLLYKHY